MNDLKTVGDLQSRLTTHRDVGVALTLQDAIRHAIAKKGLKSDTELSVSALEEIRQSVYDLNDPARGGAGDPMKMLLTAMMSVQTGAGSGNVVEDALQYIEQLQKNFSSKNREKQEK